MSPTSPSALIARLEALNLLSTPVWLFDVEHFAMLWANGAALELWDAPSLDALLARNFGEVTESTRIRLHSYREGFTQGRSYVERWTFYPKGNPVVVDCRCSSTGLAGFEHAMLVEGKPVAPSNGDSDALRMVEALRHTQVMISLYSQAGKPLLRNPAGLKMFGPTDADTVSLWEHFVDPQEVVRLQAALAAGDVYSAEVEQNTLLGRRWLGVDARNTTDPVTGEKLILLNKVDISRRRTAEELRNKAVIEAENANRARSRFLANVSHELRTPMNGVIGMTSLLLGTTLDDEQRHFVETIQNSGQSLLHIINDILDFSKIDAGRLELHEAPYDIGLTVRSVVDIVSGTLAGKPLRLESAFGPGLPEKLLGDASRMKQILLNLVSNAVKFTAAGSVTIRVQVTGAAKDWLRVEVQDTGIGIAEADQAKLFQSFSQIDNRDTRSFSGTGLGLAITRQLVQMMQGRIGVQSSVGHGSTFWFELPLRGQTGPATLQETLASLAPVNGAAAKSGLAVLLVEDNLVNQRVASIMLGKLGHRVDVAGDGRQAVDAAAQARYDIIFMDVQMPEVDGYAATAAIRASRGPNVATPIIALTANAMEGDEQQCLGAGMDGYLSKPVSLPQFATVIEHHLKPVRFAS